MLRLTCPSDRLRAMVHQGLRQTPVPPVPWPLALVRHGHGDQELLVCEAESPKGIEPDAWLRLYWIDTLPTQPTVPADGEAALWLSGQGAWCGLYKPLETMGLRWPAEAIVELRIPGPGLHVLATGSLASMVLRPSDSEVGSRQGWWLAAATPRDPQGQFSRTAGAIGWPAVDTLRQSCFAVVGCSRTGLPIAHSLSTYQPRAMLLIDPDVIEPGNLDVGFAMAGLHNPDEIKQSVNYKADFLAKRICEQAPQTRVTVITRSVLTIGTLAQLATCDVIVSATDNDLARLACAVVASAYHRVHLDLGSQVTHDAEGGRLLGADIRLTLPGNRCLCCLGALSQSARVEDFALGRSMSAASDWRLEKAGALSSWSSIVAGLGMRLLEDLACERISESTWLRITHEGPSPAPRIQQVTAPPDRYCPVCACSGRGADVLHRLHDLAAAAVVRMKRRSEMKATNYS